MAKSKTQRGNPNWKPGISGNPKGRPPVVAEVRSDGWQSSITGIGSALADKSETYQFKTNVVTDLEAREIYRGDDLAARGVDLWPDHMLREGWEICIADDKVIEGTDLEDDPAEIPSRYDAARAARLRQDAIDQKTKDLISKVEAKACDLGLCAKLYEAIAYSRAYGGGAILIGANDLQTDWSKPLDPKRVASIDWLTVLEPRELQPYAVYSNPRAAKYGETAIWQITSNTPGNPVEKEAIEHTILVHETRLIVFQGIKVSRDQIVGRAGWGDSIFTRVKPVLRNFNVGWAGASLILQELSTAYMKIKGLAEMVSTDAQKKLFARMAAVNLGMSLAKMRLLDTEEEFGRTNIPLSGLPELLDRFWQRLAAAYGVPVTLLAEVSPSGLNATGESDVRGFYDLIASAQPKILTPALRKIYSLIMTSLRIPEPASWSIEYKPLWQQTAKEIADTRFVGAQTDEKNITNGIYSAEEARRSRYGGDKYSQEIVLDSSTESDNYDPQDASMLGGAQSAKPGDSGADPSKLTSILTIVKAVNANEIAREGGLVLLTNLLGIDPATADLLVTPTEKPDPPSQLAPQNLLPKAPAQEPSIEVP